MALTASALFARRGKAPRAPRFRPTAELLEGRDVPSATVDLTTPGSGGVINGAVFSTTAIQPTGTGVIDSFLRLQAGRTGVEQGYNTDGPTQFDEKGGNFTRSLRLGEVPMATIDGVAYREFLLDINESTPQALLSLDELRFYVAGQGDLTGYDAATKQLAGHDPVYDLDAGTDNWVLMDYSLNHGSGSGDVFVYIPARLFASDDPNPFVYLYCKLGVHARADAGFEEWAVVSRASTASASLSGFVYHDANNDGTFGADEFGLAGVLVTLTGIDEKGQAVLLTTYTDANGRYAFENLRPGQYTLTEAQPPNYLDGVDTIGTQGGEVGQDMFFNIFLGPGVHGTDNNFGEVLGGGGES